MLPVFVKANGAELVEPFIDAAFKKSKQATPLLFQTDVDDCVCGTGQLSSLVLKNLYDVKLAWEVGGDEMTTKDILTRARGKVLAGLAAVAMLGVYCLSTLAISGLRTNREHHFRSGARC